MLKLRYLSLIIIPSMSFALSWNDLWQNPNQQGKNLYSQNKHAEAAEAFQDSDWKGTAYYKAKQYEKAYEQFSKDNSAAGYYNQGNALAQMQRYQEALDAYNKSLVLNKDDQDTKANIELMKKLLKDQQNKQDQQDKQKDQDKKSDDKKDNKDNKDSKENKQDKQNQDSQQNNKDQKNQKDNSNKENQQNNPQNKQKEQDKKQGNKSEEQKSQPQKKAEQNKQSAEEQEKPAQPAQLTPEQKKEQKLNAVLSQIPDDPSGLLRNKFLRDYQREQSRQ